MLQHAPLIIRNALRNRRRSILTVLSVGLSLFLLGMLMTLYQVMFEPAESSTQALRLIVHHKVALTQSLPMSYKQQLLNTPGVVGATAWQWYGGIYKDAREQKNNFARFGAEPAEFLAIYPEFTMPAEEREAFIKQQTGCIVGRDLAVQHGWKLGERITLVGDIFPVTLELTLVGIFDDPDRSPMLIFNNKYLQESLPPSWAGRDSSGTFMILARSPEEVPMICKTIDDKFANAAEPTRTESERDFALSFLAFLGNIRLFLAAIGAAVTFTILLVSANTVAMTVRERTRETAILRTLGFTPLEILTLILGEAVFLAVIGGLVGTVLAAAACSSLKNLSAAASFGIRFQSLSPVVFAIVLGVAAVVGLLSAAGPAWITSRKSVVESMKFTG